jgi:uncharacterized protein DUF4440
MKPTTVLICLLLTISLGAAQAQTSKKTPPRHASTPEKHASAGSDREVVMLIRDLEETERRSALSGDSSWWERHTDDNYVEMDAHGKILSRADAIKLHTAPEGTYDEINLSDMTIRTYNGDTVIISGKRSVESSSKGQDVAGEFHFIHVWIKEGTEWKLAMGQMTKAGQ